MRQEQSNQVWAAWGVAAVLVSGLACWPRSEPPRYSQMPTMQTIDGEMPKIEIHDDGSVTTNIHPADDIYSTPTYTYKPDDIEVNTSIAPLIGGGTVEKDDYSSLIKTRKPGDFIWDGDVAFNSALPRVKPSVTYRVGR